MNNLKVGVIGTSKKEDEQRYPIHPAFIKNSRKTEKTINI